ncbi:MAG: alpha/beta fold hydrolase [Bacteroidetes bacterium]|nr:alpha/beta fold hydrolase [Bacteroidota bacterium]
MEKLQYINIDDYLTENGTHLTIQLSYQTFGKNIEEAPVVLVNHALTGNSNVCGSEGWWKDLIGEDKCIDTNIYTILAFNIPGNGIDGITENLIDNYKDFNARDIAKIFILGIEQLKINKIFAVIGGSVGGGIAWELAAFKPDLFEHVIPIAADWKSTDWLIANCYIQDNILNNSSKPLSDARIHAMTLYRTPESLAEKFGRTKKDVELYNVESWLHYHGKVLNERFQLAAYKMMNQVLRTIDIVRDKGDFLELAATIKSHIHIITINSDLFFKAEENWNTYVDLKSIKENVDIGEIKSIHGHDGFLIEYEQLSKLLEPVFQLQTDKLNITA